MYQIESIILDNDFFQDYDIQRESTDSTIEDFKTIQNLSKVNLFIGSNNSGKSRFIRALFAEDTYTYRLKKFDFDFYYKIIKEFILLIIESLQRRNIIRIGNLEIENIKRIKIYEYYVESSNIFGEINGLLQNIGKLKPTNNGITYNGSSYRIDEEHLVEELKHAMNQLTEKIEENYNKEIKFYKVYIPTLRGLRTFTNSSDLYLERTKRDYFTETSNEIFTGLNLYDEIKKLLLGSLKDRNIISEYQKFLSVSFFESKEITLIPNIDSDVLFVKIGSEKERPIYSLGDGIQSLIIMTFPLFKYKDENILLFIEEPEQYLHPGMQRKFLEIIYNLTNIHSQFFITTHSNHFLDMTLDMSKISTYCFSKDIDNDDSIDETNAKFYVSNTSNEDINLLTILGVKNSAVLMSNSTIWVEGITDRFYIRHFLKLYMQKEGTIDKYQEDIHFSFVEYGGNNITHWSFLEDDSDEELYKNINVERLCARLFLITDKDGNKKTTRHEKLKKSLKENYYCLECREIENLIDVTVLKKVIAEYEGLQVEEVKYKQNFTYDGYKNKSLGAFIEKQLEVKKRSGKYASDSGTITNKVKFCKKVINHTTNFEDLSKEAQMLTKRIYQFISECN